MLWTARHVLAFEDRLRRIINHDYQDAMRRVWWPNIMGTRASTGKREIIEWLLNTAQIVKLPNGQMQFDDLVTQAHEAVNIPRGGGLRMDRDKWEDDEAKLASEWASQMGSEMAMSPQYECIDLIKYGEVGLAYDGRPFHGAHLVNPFDESRGEYRTLIDSMAQFDPSLPALPPELTPDSFSLGVAHMKTFEMPNGRNRNLEPRFLLIPPQLEKVARTVTGAKIIEATENVITDYHVQPLVIHELAHDPRSWILIAPGSGELGMPYIWQERRPYGMTSYDGITDAELARANHLEWHVRGRNAAIYGHPFRAVKFKVPGPQQQQPPQS
ncbi:Mu-like prophage major head subunit gpT family protein [Chondromyces crocatus]|uniref:Bacteriophage Mu GpT domain-containing protein n=1 Tax=Chondromyces crocatus TaxID=52 RepID=A0A0K1EBN0_CHOCO|nr:Mu-like prophage major head subunit gpT family protein [Chondromyces crocatus]AKT38259.1 uncharacterized protein CMC5_024020 [Chondromyces crocatus]